MKPGGRLRPIYDATTRATDRIPISRPLLMGRGVEAGPSGREGNAASPPPECPWCSLVCSHVPVPPAPVARPASDFDVADRVREVAALRGAPAAQVALAWLLHRPGVTAPIVGATKLSHLEDALAAEKLELSEDEMRQLEGPYIPHAISGHRWGNGGRPDPAGRCSPRGRRSPRR